MRTLNLPFIFFCLLSFSVTLTAQRSAISASVGMYKGKPTILLNGKPQTPVIYSLTDVPGGRWPWEEVPRHTLQTFCEANIHLIQVDLFFDHVWMENNSINIDTARMLLRAVLDACPDASILIRFHVNPPKWWQSKYPEENTVYADGSAKKYHGAGLHRLIQDDEKTVLRYSLASTKWINDASLHLKLFLQALQKIPEANALMGIQVAGGVFGEWHYWGFLDNEPDMSNPMLLYFRGWLENKYQNQNALQAAWKDSSVNFQNASLPGVSERTTTKAGIFREPDTERKIIDYYEAQHDCVAEDIIHFCRIVKENWPRPIITGTFYGYFYSVFGREAAGGHLSLMKVLNSPWVDYLSGPHAYYPDAGSEPGDPYRSRSLINSIGLHGKLWLDEMDIRPPLVDLSDSDFDSSLQKSIATTRQNMLFTYSKGMGFWFYDFGPSGMAVGSRTKNHGNFGWWDEPSLMKDIRQVKALMDSNLEKMYSNDADVLVVHDTKTFYYTSSAKSGNSLEHWANNWVPVAIFRSGVVHDVIHIDDLGSINLDQYKAIVFVNDWVMNDQQKEFIRKKLARNHRHLVFIYAPGYSNEEKLDPGFIETVTGIKTEMLKDTNYSFNNHVVDPMFVITDKKAIPLEYFKGSSRIAFARKAFPDYDSWYMVLPSTEPAVWRNIFRKAGANIYDEDGDIFYTGHNILSVHTVAGGEKNIHLKNGKSIHLRLPPISTTLMNPETGEVILP